MLYRFRPPSALDWCDIPGRSTLDDAAKYRGDLDRLPWKPTETIPFTIDGLRIALRHGAATTSGIALDAIHTADLGRADEIRRAHRAADDAAHQLLAEHGDLNDQIRESSEQAAQEAERDHAEVLAASINAELADHWQKLGGALPE